MTGPSLLPDLASEPWATTVTWPGADDRPAERAITPIVEKNVLFSRNPGLDRRSCHMDLIWCSILPYPETDVPERGRTWDPVFQSFLPSDRWCSDLPMERQVVLALRPLGLPEWDPSNLPLFMSLNSFQLLSFILLTLYIGRRSACSFYLSH